MLLHKKDEDYFEWGNIKIQVNKDIFFQQKNYELFDETLYCTAY